MTYWERAERRVKGFKCTDAELRNGFNAVAEYAIEHCEPEALDSVDQIIRGVKAARSGVPYGR